VAGSGAETGSRRGHHRRDTCVTLLLLCDTCVTLLLLCDTCVTLLLLCDTCVTLLQIGPEKWLDLELKLVADVGIIGVTLV
jgi:hypothetical protein